MGTTRLQVEYLHPDELKPFEGNPRKITEQGLEKLEQSLETFGFTNPILAQKGTRIVIAGHQRLKAAKAAGLLEVPVIFLDLDDEKAKAYNLADNRLNQESSWDNDPLVALLEELTAADFDLTLTGFDENELSRLIGETPEVPEEPDEIEPPIEPIAAKGDLWQLGDHFLLCGDATDRDNVACLLDAVGEKKIHLLFTSPPYPGAAMWETEGEELVQVGNAVLAMAPHILTPGGVLVWNTADVPLGNKGYVCNIARDTITALEVGLKKRGEVIWDKGVSYMPLPGMTRRPTVPNNTHEAILVFFNGDWKPRDKKGSLHAEARGWNLETVWTIGTESAKRVGHIAPFPVEMALRVLTLWSLEGDVVFDPFMGSGTTIIAAEQLGRRALGCEINPVYVDVAVRRWEELTGKKAVRLGG